MSKTIHLQGVGKFQAKPASEIKPGDVLVWNYGSTSTVLTVETRGKSVFTTQTAEKIGIFERRFLGTRLVACTSA
jgi:hypothetical protein